MAADKARLIGLLARRIRDERVLAALAAVPREEFVPPELRDEAFSAGATINQRNRCPGAADQEAEDGSNPWRPNPEFNCDPSQVLSGR